MIGFNFELYYGIGNGKLFDGVSIVCFYGFFCFWNIVLFWVFYFSLKNII